jgi:hypothetical protein
MRQQIWACSRAHRPHRRQITCTSRNAGPRSMRRTVVPPAGIYGYMPGGNGAYLASMMIPAALAARSACSGAPQPPCDARMRRRRYRHTCPDFPRPMRTARLRSRPRRGMLRSRRSLAWGGRGGGVQAFEEFGPLATHVYTLATPAQCFYVPRSMRTYHRSPIPFEMVTKLTPVPGSVVVAGRVGATSLPLFEGHPTSAAEPFPQPPFAVHRAVGRP